MALKLALSIAMLAVSILAMLQSIDQSKFAAVSLAHTHFLLNLSKSVQSSSYEHKALVGLFLRTRDTDSFAEMHHKRESISEKLTEMQLATVGNADQQRQVKEIVNAFKAVVKESESQQPRMGGLIMRGPTISIIGEGQVDSLNAALIARLNAFDTDLQTLSERQQADASSNSRRAELVMLGSLLAGIGLLLMTFMALRREVTRRQESEERWQFALEGGGDGVWDWNLETNQTFYSPRWWVIHGYSKGHAGTGMDVWESSIHPEDLPEVLSKVQSYFDKKTTLYASDHRVICKDGSIKWVHEQGMVPKWDATGRPTRMIGTLMDISDRKQMETSLQENEQRLRYMLEKSPIAVRIARTGGREVIFANSRYAALINIPADRVAGTDPKVFYANHDVYEEILRKLKNGEEIFDQLVELVIPGFGTKWTLASYVQTQFEGEAVVLGWFYDITELKVSEGLLKRSEAKLRAIFTTINDLIWLKDCDGFYLSCNPMFERFFGAKEADIIGKTDYDFVDAELANLFRENDKIAMSKGGPSTNEEWVTFADDGHHALLETTKSPIYDAEGHLIGVLGISHDITQRKHAESELQIAATAFESQDGMLITDANNVILRVNQAFTRITGYRSEEAIGQTPRLLSSGRQDAAFFKDMWDSILSTGSWGGEIWNRRKSGEVYPEQLNITAVKDSRGAIINYVAIFSDITLKKAAADEIKNLAYYDPLTGLPNRRLLLDRLHQAMASSSRSGKEGALLFIDLDNFKELNDTLGHDVGDLLLREVATRLSASVREGDTVSRLGGDEFVVMLEDLSEKGMEAASQVEVVGDKILSALNKPYILGSHECRNTPSIGAALFNAHQSTIDELLKQADIAMYQSKTAGRNRLRFFDPKMQESINARVLLESELRKAIDAQQFLLHYQVQVDDRGRPTGAEALIRWAHPLRGIVSPANFISLAEESGIILPLGEWILDTACAQLKFWQTDPVKSQITLAVNVSPSQFRQPDFAAQVLSAVARHDIDPRLLKLELTESLFLDDIGEAITTMSILHEEGIQFSLDDFGTGYSSLQYLKRLPLNQLKIDQSFVRDIVSDNNDREIVGTIIAMAKNLKLNVIAEGVETEEQLQLLKDSGCLSFQGYLFSKPLSLEEFELIFQEKKSA